MDGIFTASANHGASQLSSPVASFEAIRRMLAIKEEMRKSRQLSEMTIIAHPNNIDLLPMTTEPLEFNEPLQLRVRFDGIPFIADRYCALARKTGRVIWEPDPWVTYEEKDREWGLKLGFCKEEEEPVFYAMPMPSAIFKGGAA